ncbi:MAG: hypothetical protein AAF399_19495 [Bacteroidota bacterium]
MSVSPKFTAFSLSITGLLMVGAVVLIAFLLITVLQYPNLLPDPAPEPIATAPSPPTPMEDAVENGLDMATGFVAQGEYQLVKTTCTACHSSKLVLQNRATREGWSDMIDWMQETQKLWDLGENEDKILDYLAEHYGPTEVGRRANLAVDEWYEIAD